MDNLKVMFEYQKAYQVLAGNGEFPRISGENVSTFALGLVAELGEVLQEYKGWKPWKTSDYYTHNKDECLEELADMWHFMINLSLALGFDNDDVVYAFNKKHKKILERLGK